LASLVFDWFRNIDGDGSLVARNIAWSYHYFRSSKAIDVELRALEDQHRRVEDVYKTLNLAYNQYGWAYLYDNLESFPLAHEFFLAGCHGNLIIGYELSRSQKEVIKKAGKKFIDIRTHPIRFLNDYHFGAATNDPDIHSRLMSLSPDRSYIDLHVNFHRARAARRYQRRLNARNGLVFFAQTAFDSARIKNGEMLDDSLIVSGIEEYIKQNGQKNIYVKHHPHEKMRPDLLNALKGFGAKETTTATYDLLSVEDIRICALSSGVCHEVEYFGGMGLRFFMPPEKYPIVGDGGSVGDYMLMPTNFYSEAIWNFILYGKPCNHIEYPTTQTPYRVASGLSWG
jgi:hypothetical protein